MTLTPYSDLMTYVNTYDKTDNFLKKFDNIRKRLPAHKATPVIELVGGAVSASNNTKYMAGNSAFFHYIKDVSDKYNRITIHQYQVRYKEILCDYVKKDTK